MVDALRAAGYQDGIAKDFLIRVTGNEVVVDMHPGVARVAGAILGRYGLRPAASASHDAADRYAFPMGDGA